MTSETELKHLKEMEVFFGRLDPKVKKNAQVVTKESLGQDYMLRIDTKAPKQFTPYMPFSAGKTEDRTTPRVCVSTSLLDCFLGYASVSEDFHGDNHQYSYDITKIPFDVCLKPNEKLVYDALLTNEHWLVPYNQDSYRIKGSVIGKVHVVSITYEPAKDSSGNHTCVKAYVELNGEHPVKLLPDKSVSKGHYIFTFENNGNIQATVRKISKSEFDAVIKPIGHKLQLESFKPPTWVTW